MIKVLAPTGLALAVAAVSCGVSLAAAVAPGEIVKGWAISEPVLQQRIDTEEVALPPQPTGPATPIPFCSPSSPICP